MILIEFLFAPTVPSHQDRKRAPGQPHRSRLRTRIVLKAGVADVIVNSYCEVVLGFRPLQVVVDRLYHGRGELF